MSEIQKTTYFGLPIPDYDEQLSFQYNNLSDNSSRNLDIIDITIEIFSNSPLLEKVITHDINHWLDYESPEDYKDDEILEFCNGVRNGYTFFIGFQSSIKLMRSDYENIGSFIDSMIKKDELPLVRDKDLDRIMKVRSGDALLDEYVSFNYLDDSSGLSYISAEQYTFEALGFETIVLEEIEKIQNKLEHIYGDDFADELCAHVTGFKHGLANSIEMYLQITEEHIISSIENMK